MTDKREAEDELELADDEELMTDFADLFPDDEAESPALASATGDSDDGSLDELDAFLDDFEKNLDIPDSDDAAEVSTPPSAATRELSLDKEELDLDVGLDGEIFMDEVSLDEDEDEDDALLDLDAMMDEAEPSVTTGQAELPLETPRLVAAAATAAAAVSAANTAPLSPSPGRILPPAAAPALSRPQLIAGVALLSVSLLLSLAALWLGLGLNTQIDILNQNVSELQQRVLAQSRRGTIAPQAELGDQLNRLGERVNELAVIIEGPVSHLRESSQQELQALNLRLERLEQGRVQHPPAAEIASTPLVSKAEPVAATPQSTKPGGWVINLLSVASAKTAAEELARLRKLGIRADQQTVNQSGKIWYRLRVTGFDSYAGAKAYIETVEQQTGFSAAWVAKAQ